MREQIEKHLAQTRESIEAGEALALQHRGRAARIEDELLAMRKHVAVLEELLKGGENGVAG